MKGNKEKRSDKSEKKSKRKNTKVRKGGNGRNFKTSKTKKSHTFEHNEAEPIININILPANRALNIENHREMDNNFNRPSYNETSRRRKRFRVIEEKENIPMNLTYNNFEELNQSENITKLINKEEAVSNNNFNGLILSDETFLNIPRQEQDFHIDFFLNLSNDEMALLLERNRNYLQNNLQILPSMRATVLAWLINVSEALCLKRTSYHLAVTLFDNFLSNVTNFNPNILQLLGITCLIIAAKNEVN